MEKKELRQLMREKKATCTPQELAAESERICRKILRHPLWKRARTVLLYHALPDEVSTRLLLEQGQDKCLLLPVVVGDDLELRQYTGAGNLRTGSFCISEPTGPQLTPTFYHAIDLVIVPGMAFDAEGHRLGRGRGYYDRLLPRISAPKFGVCFPFQMVPRVPTEEHDCRMDRVVF